MFFMVDFGYIKYLFILDIVLVKSVGDVDNIGDNSLSQLLLMPSYGWWIFNCS